MDQIDLMFNFRVDRKLSGFTLKDVSEVTRISHSCLSRFENLVPLGEENHSKLLAFYNRVLA